MTSVPREHPAALDTDVREADARLVRVVADVLRLVAVEFAPRAAGDSQSGSGEPLGFVGRIDVLGDWYVTMTT